MLRCKTTWTLALTAVLIAAGGLLRPPDGQSGLPVAQFWAMKVKWPAAFDVVLAGDSRTLTNLSPATMQQALPGRRIANFGFPRCAWDEPYLEAVDRLLDPSATRRVIVIGITPLSLTPLAKEANRFKEYGEKDNFELYQHLWAGEAFHYLRGFAWGHLLQSLGEDRRVVFSERFDDGWSGLTQQPYDPKASLEDYKETFDNNQVLADMQDALLQRVGTWNEAGVVVYGYRPPVPSWTLQMEEKSGFDEGAFVQRFTQAGGRWLDLPFKENYKTSDGSHLVPESAITFSKLFAQTLADDLATFPPTHNR